MDDRKTSLRLWLAEHPDVTMASLGREAGVPQPRAWEQLMNGPISGPLLNAALAAGIPRELLPPKKRPKAEIYAENRALRERVALLENRLAERGIDAPA